MTRLEKVEKASQLAHHAEIYWQEHERLMAIAEQNDARPDTGSLGAILWACIREQHLDKARDYMLTAMALESMALELLREL